MNDKNELVRMFLTIKFMELAEEIGRVDPIAETSMMGFASLISSENYVLVDFIEWSLNKIKEVQIEHGDFNENMYLDAMKQVEDLKELI